MPLIEGFWIRNFRVLKQVAFGSSFQRTTLFQDDLDFEPYVLNPVTAFTGRNGTGKSTALDVFAFLSECLNEGTDAAFDRRNGFQSIVSRGCEKEAISIGIVFRACADPRPLTYIVSFETGRGRTPIVSSEALLYRSDEQNPNNTMLLFCQNGAKTTRHVAPWPGMLMEDLKKVKNTDAHTLALGVLGSYEDYPDVHPLKLFLTGWGFQSLTLDLAASLSVPSIPRNTNEQRLNRMLESIRAKEEKNRFEFTNILSQIASRLPGVEQITLDRTESGRFVLRFKLQTFEKPLEAHEVNRGLLHVFAHLLHLEDPIPSSFFGLESPEFGLDSDRCALLAERIYDHADHIGSTQFFASVHSPLFLDRLAPRDVWVLETAPDGFSTTFRASDDLAARGITSLQPGERWYSDFLGRE